MATECYSQLGFGFQPKLVVDFAGGTLTTDAGLLLVREFDEQLGLSADVVSRDHRHPRPAVHHARRRHARAPAAVSDRRGVRGRQRRRPAAARSRRSKWSRRMAARRSGRNRRSRGWRMRSSGPRFSAWRAPASTGSVRTPTGPTSIRPISFSISTARMIRPTGRSNSRSFMAGTTSTCITRSSGSKAARACCCGRGCVPAGTRVRPVSSTSSGTCCRRCAGAFRTRRFSCAATRGWRHRPSKPSWKPKASSTCWASARIASSRRAWRRSSRRRRRATSGASGPCTSAPAFGIARSRGPITRRILVKIDVTAAGLNVRFMVTNRRGHAADLVAWYDDRGTSENWIKELKLDIHADRLSCHRFRANAFRLQLHSLALLLLAYFRRTVLAGTRLASATVGTIRLHLLKVAGRVVRSVRRLWFHLASHWPGQPLFTRCHRALARAPA